MSYAGGPYLQASFDNMLSANVIGPLDIPYSRTLFALNDVVNMLYTDFVPWEIWIDYDGNVYMGVEKGSDKSTSIILEAGGRLNKVTAERTTKQTAQRIKVTGQGESKTQDDITSDWQADTDVMNEINTFYEKIHSERKISNKSIADIEAKILLVAQSQIREQITLVDVDFSPYTANDVDVGDYVTAIDPDSGLSSSYRLKTIEKTVDSSGGEEVNITVTKMRTDITDRLSILQKKLNEVQSSGTALEKLLDSGGKQGNINPDKIENVWQITSSNKLMFEVPEDSTDAAPDEHMTFTMAAGGGAYKCEKDWFYVLCNTAAQDDVYLYNTIRELDFQDDARFSCEIEMDEDVGDAWQTNDQVIFGIWDANQTVGFGFRIKRLAAGWEIDIMLDDLVAATRIIDISAITGAIESDVKYRLEARLDWDEKIVRYYFGSSSREFGIIGIFPISLTANATGQMLCPMHIRLRELSVHANTIMIVFYNWRSQANAMFVS